MWRWWDFGATLMISILIVEMTSKGSLHWLIAAPMLVVFVIFRAFTRAIGGIRGYVYWPFTILFTGILILFIVLKGGGQDIFPILIGTFFGGLEKILARILSLASEGYVPIYLVILSVFGLVFLRWVGLGIGSKLIYHSIFSIVAPVFILLTFLSTASRSNWQDAVIIAGTFLALLTMLEGLYIMFYGLFSTTRRG